MEVGDSCFSGNPTTRNSGGSTAITSLHSDIIRSHILNKLDGPTLASTSCASPQLHTICSEENLWKNICNSNFPSTTDPRVQNIISSFPSGHRSFFSDSFPTLHHHHQPKSKNIKTAAAVGTPELISAIDVHCGDYLVYSKVVVTQTLTGPFTFSPLRIDLVKPKEFVPIPVKFDGEESQVMKILEEKMKLSWIIIDPTRKRAVNLSSNAPVEVTRRHWLTGDIKVCYGTVKANAGVDGGQMKYWVEVTCGGKDGGEMHVREISMQVEDMEGKIMSGKDSLVILHETMEGKRTKLEIGEERRRHEKFLERRRIWREYKKKRQRRVDMVWAATVFTIFIAFWALILFG